MKTISAVIVNWNGCEATVACIESLFRQEGVPDLEIIVSDNGSTDGSNETIRERFPSVRLIENGRNLGFGAAVNRGFSVARGEYLIFLNNDLVLAPDSLRELVTFLDARPAAGAAVPKILYREQPDVINSYGVDIHYTGMAFPHLLDQPDTPDLAPLETACGGIFLMRRDLYETVGGFDEDLFLYHEDHDLSWRIRLAGRQLWVCPTAVFQHDYTFHKGARKFYSSEKNRLHILFKLYSGRTLLLITPALLVVEIAQWGHGLLNGWFGLKLKSYWELAGLLPKIHKKRRRIQRARQVTDREISRLHQGTLRLSGIDSPLLSHGLSPLLKAYWRLIRNWI